MIKVIKRTTVADIPHVLPTKSLPVRPVTVTTTVKDWIAESRKNRIEKDNSARNTIAGWTAEP
ncbi:MAG TPA: hypothetical protein VFZ23_10260 [Pyrinomonadaceae bacterium]